MQKVFEFGAPPATPPGPTEPPAPPKKSPPAPTTNVAAPSRSGAQSEERRRMNAQFEAGVVRALLRDWNTLNHRHFGEAMKAPSFLLSDAELRLGRWTPGDRTIEIARHLAFDKSWGVVVEVLKHEMAHQYVHEVLKRVEETAHGEAFRAVCSKLGIDATASGMPLEISNSPLPDEEARVLGRIAKLLALAESPNQNEAELAMREAQRLMLKHNLQAGPSSRKRSYGFRHLGEPTARLQLYERLLASILGGHFFVETIWVTVYRPEDEMNGTVLEICGSAANLEMASYVHAFLLQTAERLWREHKRSANVRGDTDRRSYLTGVMRGFLDKLETQRKENQAEGLVWVRDAGLRDFLKSRYPRLRSLRRAARTNAAAFSEGQKAGRSIVLNRPVTGGGTRGGLALPPRR